MGIDARDVLVGIVIGIGGTLVMDLWNLFLKRTFSIQSIHSTEAPCDKSPDSGSSSPLA